MANNLMVFERTEKKNKKQIHAAKVQKNPNFSPNFSYNCPNVLSHSAGKPKIAKKACQTKIKYWQCQRNDSV